MRGKGEYPARSPKESREEVEARRRTAGEHGPGACEGKHVQPPPGSADIRRNEGAFLMGVFWGKPFFQPRGFSRVARQKPSCLAQQRGQAKRRPCEDIPKRGFPQAPFRESHKGTESCVNQGGTAYNYAPASTESMRGFFISPHQQEQTRRVCDAASANP